jgi:predicted transcriptional regulator
LHEKDVGSVPIDRRHIDDVARHILWQFQIGQTGFRSKSFDDVLHEAKKNSRIGEDVLDELIKRGVVKEEKAGSRRSLEIAEKGAVSSFLQQSILRGRLVDAIERLAKRHASKKT